MKMVNLRKVLKSLIKEAHPEVYFRKATKKAEYPYIVFNLPNSVDDGSLENFVLDVDCWDEPKNGDTTAVETVIAQVDAVLQRSRIVIDDSTAAVIYRDNRLVLDDDNPQIERRKYIYQVRTYEKRRLN